MIASNHYFVPEIESLNKLKELPEVVLLSIISKISSMNKYVSLELKKSLQSSHLPMSI